MKLAGYLNDRSRVVRYLHLDRVFSGPAKIAQLADDRCLLQNFVRFQNLILRPTNRGRGSRDIAGTEACPARMTWVLLRYAIV